MNGSLGRTTAAGEERVTYKASKSRPDRFKPQIAGLGDSVRSFETDDMGRILDYDGLTSTGNDGAGSDSVTEGTLMLCEIRGSSSDDIAFKVYYCCVRGGFLFYFDTDDVDDEGRYASYHNPPTGVIPLENVEIEYPPGGRRVFREHAQTDAKNGYEFAVAHVQPRNRASASADAESSKPRPPFFLVADSLGKREKWSVALRARVELADKPTLLRAGYTKIVKASTDKSKDLDGAKGGNAAKNPFDDDDDGVAAGTNPFDGEPTKSFDDDIDRAKKADSKAAESKKGSEKPSSSKEDTAKKSSDKKESDKNEYDRKEDSKKAADKEAPSRSSESEKTSPPRKRNNSSKKSSAVRTRDRDVKSVKEHILDASNDEGLASAVVEFGIVEFSEQEWMDTFFQIHNDFDAPTKCREMEEWQGLMKRSLKGAVLEQYEYFVQASGQMTTMGREVSSLKTLVESQVETIREMKEIDFASAMKNDTDGQDELMGRDDEDKPDAIKYISGPRSKMSGADDRSAFSELSGEGGAQPADADDFDDDPSAPPIDIPEWLLETTEEIAAFVRECRYIDSIDLLLKAKAEVNELFDKHERPTAYRLRKAQVAKLRGILHELNSLSSRISNRLEESLRRKNEALRQAAKRERSDAHAAASTMISPCAVSDDTLYLQLLVKLGRNYQAAEAYSARRTLLLLETLHERPISGSGSVDLVIYAAQLSQSFFSVLASSVEGFLDLFLATNAGAAASNNNANTEETMSQGDSSSIHSNSNNSKSLPSGAIAAVVLWCDGELSKFAAAFGGTRILANLALSPPPSSSLMEKRSQARIIGQENNDGKERQNAIQVAAQCLDQAFQHASSNLDAVGLPLTPRLAEYIRVRLKGCEAEVAELLDERWHGFTNEWRASAHPDGIEANGNGMAIGY
ncbi:hypothetical protein ACA910_004846 [Epithemia clementina (nom. ined.)]